MHATEMLTTNPGQPLLTQESLIRCIEACFDCAQVCSACADACLGEAKLDMLRRCIRLNQDCSDVCVATGRMLSRQQQPDMRVVTAMLETCLVACAACGDECALHGKMHEHCRVCAESCRRCVRACKEALGALGVGSMSTASA